MSIYEKAEIQIQNRNYWRAKEILKGNISNLGYDTQLFEKIGALLILMGDKIEAGRFLFLSGANNTEYQEPVNLFLKRYTRKEYLNLLSTFPKVARLKDISDYPPPVASELKRLGINNEDLYWKVQSFNYAKRESISDKLIPIGIGGILLLVLLCVVIGFFTIGKWVIQWTFGS